jgi:MSHA pilin protein MshC
VKGFSLIELVTVILLLGIVTAVVAPRWFDTGDFDASVISTEVLSVARLAQRTAVARPGVDISLTIVRVGDQWRLEVLADDAGTVTMLHGVSVDVSSSIVATAGVAGPATLSTTDSLALTYDALGSTASVQLAGSPGTVESGVSLNLGSGDLRLCISPLGFAHAGNCI